MSSPTSSSSCKSAPIPPGVLTPYIMDEMLNEIEDKRTLVSKLEEANSEKNDDHYHGDINLPLYEHSQSDILLERGSTIKRNSHSHSNINNNNNNNNNYYYT